MPAIDLTFTCPKCGSHNFGSSIISRRRDEMERLCHGRVKNWRGAVISCGFTFHDREDWKYFRVPGVRAFANKGEHDLIMAIIRSSPAYGIGGGP